MDRHTIGQKDYLMAGQVFNWATKEHYIEWFTGKCERHRRTEAMLPRLVRKGKLRSYKYGKRLIYIVRRKSKNGYLPHFEHGLGCTEGLVRIWRSDMEGIIIQERYFRGFGIVPEWGIKYKDKLLLYEFCTKDNFNRSGLVKSKVTRYRNFLPALEEAFGAKCIVLFVLDIERERVLEFVKEIPANGDQFLFTDYETFKSVPLGRQLEAPIYIWFDGESYSLKHD